MMDVRITQDEIKEAIKKLKHEAAGTDGFPTEFFKVFLDSLLPVLIAALMEGKMPPSWSEVVLILITNPGKDKTLCQSYRLIALLNVDMKIFTTILSRRLQKIITHYIASDQTGFIPGRSITDSIQKTLNLISHCRLRKINSLLVAIGFEKAFDLVEFAYLNYLLHHMNFGGQFKMVIVALYSGPNARIRINNKKSNVFSIVRGTRQGCPLSPLLFALCVEPLVNLIWSDKTIRGIKVNTKEYKIKHVCQ